MAFGANSKIFRNWLADGFANVTSAIDLDTDVPYCALYSDTGTPDQNATAANTAYGAGAWIVGNEKTDTNWPAGGRAMTPTTHWSSDAGIVWYDSTDTTGAGNVTLTGVMGCLVYDYTVSTPVDNIGMSYHSFGVAQGVTAGTFTVVWDGNGVFRYTL